MQACLHMLTVDRLAEPARGKFGFLSAVEKVEGVLLRKRVNWINRLMFPPFSEGHFKISCR